MSLLFETICIRNGRAENLPWHQERLDDSYRAIYARRPEFRLAEVIRIPVEAGTGLFRCRIDYDKEIASIIFQPYEPASINRIRLIEDNAIEYTYKYSDRSGIDRLYTQRGSCDDVLIVKNGYITDTSAANIVFRDGKRWVTPAEPLLRGTNRARLIDSGILEVRKIKPVDLQYFSEARLINAMRELSESATIRIQNILTH